ncbi:MAG TPA: MFS transporter [Solirubrobacteraceae bacterium]|nr:MFS transporter [Solirubrobacteraceae bacterium]
MSTSRTAARAGHGYRALLRRPGYPGFVLTVGLIRMTGSMYMTTGVLLVLVRTHSAALAGVTVAAGTITAAVSAPLLGAWVDIVARRRVLIVFDQLLGAAGLVALLLLAGHAPAWTLPVDAMLMNCTRSLSYGSFFSSVVELAGPELLDQASAVEATSLNLSFVIGPALAGVVAGAAGADASILLQTAITLLAAALVALSPAFEVRPAERPQRAREALRTGARALWHNRILRRSGAANALAMSGWGMMAVGFPLYAARDLHAGAHAGGFLWAGIALGSAVGTFALAGRPSLRRVGASYGILGLSALLWPLASSLIVGMLLVTLTGFLEGPAYSGTIALRQRHMPAAVRGGTSSLLSALTLSASSGGEAIAGLLANPGELVLAFLAVNVLAAIAVAAGAGAEADAEVAQTPVGG